MFQIISNLLCWTPYWTFMFCNNWRTHKDLILGLSAKTFCSLLVLKSKANKCVQENRNIALHLKKDCLWIQKFSWTIESYGWEAQNTRFINQTPINPWDCKFHESKQNTTLHPQSLTQYGWKNEDSMNKTTYLHLSLVSNMFHIS